MRFGREGTLMGRLVTLALAFALSAAAWAGLPPEVFAPRRPPTGPLKVEVVPRAAVGGPQALAAPVPGAVILMYHKTGAFLDANGTLWYPSNYWVSGLQLESDLFYLRANGYPLISLDDVLRYLGGELALSTIGAAVSVDDGFQNNFRCALPILMGQGASAGFSIITDRISETEDQRQTEEWDYTYPGAYLIWPEVESLLGSGMTIMSHSRTHPLLTRLHGPKLTDEVSGSRDILQTRLGEPISFFAYPRGDYNQSVIDAVMAAGYAAAVSSDDGINRPGQNLFALCRIFVPGGMTVAQFSSMTTESGEPLFPGQLPLPQPHLISVTAPAQAGVGMPFALEIAADNLSAPASRGFLAVSFPDAPGGAADMSLAISEADTPGSKISWPGDTILHRQGYSMPAVHPMVEFEDSDQYSDYARTMDYDYWRSGEQHTARMQMRVRKPGPFRVWVRLAMVNADHDQAVILPESGAHDQQDWPVYEYVIDVVRLDLAPPDVVIQSPASGSVVKGAVAVTADATDAMSGVASVAFVLDGTAVSTDATAPYEWSWDTQLWPEGSHTLAAVASDNAGNFAEAAVTVTVDNSPPEVSIESPAADSVVKGIVPVRAEASDSVSGVAAVTFSLDGTPVGTDTTAPYEWNWNTRPPLAQEAHTLGARAFDLAGNFSETSITVTVDNTTFDDVPASHIFWRYVEALVAAGVTSGCSSSPALYCPDDAVSRDQMAKFLCKAAGKTELFSAAPTFSDVPAGHPFYGWIQSLADAGSWGGSAPTSGCGAGRYCPSQAVTRAQMAKFLCIATGRAPFESATPAFSDVPASHPFSGWIERLADPGSWGGTPPTSGCGGGRYCPNQTVSRGQMAKFLVLAFGMAY
jgi:peptidoglycan/xylan/chitin deacetylase (PgdA/CDA1 family)